eukprot:917087-Prymnesium_polylepis.1
MRSFVSARVSAAAVTALLRHVSQVRWPAQQFTPGVSRERPRRGGAVRQMQHSSIDERRCLSWTGWLRQPAARPSPGVSGVLDPATNSTGRRSAPHPGHSAH